MSSDDSGFDKEAEREKLREKYERDQQDRENTRRMSELLLQGATMTGKHCGECGDPVFRYDGQEFCPTCQQGVEGGGAGTEGNGTETAETNADAQDDAGGDATAENGNEPSGPEATAERPVDAADAGTADDEPRVEIEGVRVADRHADRSNLRRPPSERGGDEPVGDGRDPSRPGESGRRAGGRARQRASDARGRGARDRDAPERGGDAHGRATNASGHAHTTGDLGPARESLVRTLTDLARRAEETDDAGHARELLAATREAAEALAALDRANH